MSKIVLFLINNVFIGFFLIALPLSYGLYKVGFFGFVPKLLKEIGIHKKAEKKYEDKIDKMK